MGIIVSNIPYIKINVFELSELHNNTVASESNMVYSQQIRPIYDFVFPNPDRYIFPYYVNISIIKSILKYQLYFVIW